MKKNLLLLILSCLLFTGAFAQFPPCASGLAPSIGFRGQTLTTSITGPLLYMGYGSAPCYPGDIYLNQSGSGTTIYASTLTISNDSVYVSWQIPQNAPSGLYDLYLSTYNYHPVNGNCIIGPQQCYLPNAFGIDVSQISGHVFFDANQDSIFNGTDLYLSSQKVRLLPDNHITFTDANGQYYFLATQGNYTVKVEPSIYFDPVNIDSVQINLGASNVDSVDFALYPNSNSYYASSYLWGRARCNSNQNYNIDVYNHSVIPVNVVIKFYHSANTPYISSTNPPDSIVGDTIYFSESNVTYGQSTQQVTLSIPNIGDTVFFNIIIETYDLIGTLLASSENSITQIVRCSFDPNDKLVVPEGEMAQHYTLFSDTLFYNIRFQNTGTDTAYDVHITDTLDADLDLNSFQLISSSHQVNVVLDELSGIVDFRFYNIMLPDSNVDKPGSNGYVSYSIASKTGLPANTHVNNRAYIYFDLNAPVLTNITDNLMVYVIPVGIQSVANDENVSVYPNPVSQSLNIRIKNNSNHQNTFLITDMSGREVVRQNINGEYSTIDLSNLSSGIYMYRLINNQNNNSNYGRIVKY